MQVGRFVSDTKAQSTSSDLSPGDQKLWQRIQAAPIELVDASNLFIESDFQSRTHYPTFEHNAMVDALNRAGQLQAGLGRSRHINGLEVVEVIVGNRRARGILDARCELDSMAIKLLEGLTDEEWREVVRIENLIRADPTPWDIAAEAHRLVEQTFKGSRHARKNAATHMGFEKRKLAQYLELYEIAERSPTLRAAAQKQSFMVSAARVWADNGGCDLDAFAPSAEGERDHAARIATAAALLAQHCPEPTDREDAPPPLKSREFASQLADLASSLQGRTHSPTPPSRRRAIVTEKRTGGFQVRSISVEAETPAEERAEATKELLLAIPRFARTDAELETLRDRLLDAQREVEQRINAEDAKRGDAPRYAKRVRRRKPVTPPVSSAPETQDTPVSAPDASGTRGEEGGLGAPTRRPALDIVRPAATP